MEIIIFFLLYILCFLVGSRFLGLAYKSKQYPLPPFARVNVGIDAAFSVKEKAMIIEALTIWQEAMQGILIFHIGNMSIESILHQEDDYPTTWYSISILRAADSDRATKLADCIHKKTIFGLAIYNGYMALIMADRITSDNIFISVVAHEVGHLLGVTAHSTRRDTIMYKSATQRRPVITKYDLEMLMDVWRNFFCISAGYEHPDNE